jgi:hypothetical protein
MEFKTKFNIGDEIYFMVGDTPVNETICGITSFIGTKADANGRSIKTDDKECLTHYHVKFLGTDINEQKAFATKEGLIKFISDKL